MILFIALGASLAMATALLVHQYRSRALAASEPPADEAGDRLDERRAA